MTTPDEHVAVPGRGTGGGRIACSCGQWRSEPGDGLSNEHAAHRAHRVEMGETVKPLKPTPAERLKAADAAIARVRELHQRDSDDKCGLCRYFDTTNWGGLRTHWPCDTVRALDGDTPKETTT